MNPSAWQQSTDEPIGRWTPTAASSHVVASLPHAGRRVPPEFRKQFALDPELLVSDWHTAELYDFLPELGIPAVVANLSRWVADANRSPSLSAAPRAGTTVVATHDYHGHQLHTIELTDRDINDRLALAHRPYHAALDEALAATVDRHGSALLVDLHCFAADLDADIVIGDRRGTTATATTVERVEHALAAVGLRTAINLRWTGGWIVQRCATLPGVEAVQLELNARTYVDPDAVTELPGLPDVDRERFMDLRTKLLAAFDTIVDDPSREPRRALP